MERAGQEGKSPTGEQRIMPLVPDDWTVLFGSLANIQTGLKETIRCYAPQHMAKRDTPESRAATYFWLSLLLRRLKKEILTDLAPSRSEICFRALENEERADIDALVKLLYAEVNQAHTVLETVHASGRKAHSLLRTRRYE
jgi:hypothetical protein